MPIYEYSCNDCQERFEKLVLKDIEIICPKCGSKNCQKLISLFSFRSKSASGKTVSSSSSCASCTATSCASCK